ncbi:MAG: BREX system P-loop protein BrxC [Deltaproteobacteria bacterium]|nr:BREX system P-loop protein BrxC [Deltaproteobacteria bacterium]
MQKIGELFARDPGRRIEEVIKVDQANEESVYTELTEYVATESIKEHYRTILRAIADAKADPHEGIGVWVSGFFGSGKSLFAKILGYTVGNRTVGGRTASKIFTETVKDQKISQLLDVINTGVPTHAVIFDVSMDRGVRSANERIVEIMYKALLRELDYPEDFDLAELEITLEGDGRLDDFRTHFQQLHGKPWDVRRKLGLAINEASAVLHELDRHTYSAPDSWAKGLGEKGRADIDPNRLASRAFELAARRRSGKALLFIIDEVGQYVSRSVDKMLDLQAVVQAFGVEGKNRVQARKAVAPCWIVVTSQEKLNEIVDALDSKKIELARLQERFPPIPNQIDLKQSDISEVTGKRVLEKNNAAKPVLETLYDRNEGRLKTVCSLERTHRNIALNKADFVRLYPYLPYQIDLCIDIVAGLRFKRGAQRHIGGSNRTIIKQAQQMLIHPRTNLSDAPIGTLVTLDRVYELLYAGNLLPSEVTREVDDVPKKLPGNAVAHSVAKVIALLEAVKDLPRTPHNIAVALHPSVEADSVLQDVIAALKALEAAQFVRESEEGYKLLTVQEKTWDTTRCGLSPKPAERNRIKRELFGEIFGDPKLRTYRFHNRPFKMALFVDAESVEADGQIALNVVTAEDQNEWQDRCRTTRATSNERQNDIFWVAGLTDETHRQVEDLYRSREMVSMHERLATQGKLSPEESSCLAEEKIRRDRIQRDLRSKLTDVLQAGSGFFRGVEKDGSALGKTLPDVMQGMLAHAVPALFPKIEMGVRPLKGDEAEKFLTAANLNGLPAIFYDQDNGLNLVAKQAGKFVPNATAEICKEVLDYIKREHSYGNKVTGKSLETHFEGIGYGWEGEILKVVLAVLLRGGAVEVTHQGRKYRNHNDPACRIPFTKTPAFRAASFAPREALDLKMLTDAARHFEEITGKDVDIEEGAIAAAFQKLASEDREQLLPLVARMQALHLPGADAVEEHLHTVEGILEMPADDCVKTLGGEGKSYKESRLRMKRLIDATTEENLNIIRAARSVLDEQWPAVQVRTGEGALVDRAKELQENLQSPNFFEAVEAMRQAAAAIEAEHRRLYEAAHTERATLFATAIEEIKGQPDWATVAADPSIPQAQKDGILAPLQRRSCAELSLAASNPACSTCRSSLNEIEADMAAVAGLSGAALQVLASMAAPNQRVERVRLAAFLGSRLESPADVEAGIERLKEHLLKLLAEGVRIVLE